MKGNVDGQRRKISSARRRTEEKEKRRDRLGQPSARIEEGKEERESEEN